MKRVVQPLAGPVLGLTIAQPFVWLCMPNTYRTARFWKRLLPIYVRYSSFLLTCVFLWRIESSFNSMGLFVRSWSSRIFSLLVVQTLSKLSFYPCVVHAWR